LGLAILHATESRWDAANARLGDPHPHRTAWVRRDLEPLVAGQTEAVRTALEADARAPTGTATPRQAVRRTVGSDRRHRPSRHDDESRAQGGPMGPGVIEGACRHLVNDRLEPSGMRWTTAGAQAVLDLRAVQLNGPWEAYGPFHRHQPHRRWDGTSAQVPERAEAQALTLAASSHGYPRTLVTLERIPPDKCPEETGNRSAGHPYPHSKTASRLHTARSTCLGISPTYPSSIGLTTGPHSPTEAPPIDYPTKGIGLHLKRERQ
jgi:hypothetical protein